VSSPVARVNIKGDRATGVVLESGEGDRRIERDLQRGPEAIAAGPVGCGAPRYLVRAARASPAHARIRGQVAPRARWAAAVSQPAGGRARRAAPHRTESRLPRARVQSQQVRRILERAGAGSDTAHGERSVARDRRPARAVGDRALRPVRAARGLATTAPSLQQRDHRYAGTVRARFTIAGSRQRIARAAGHRARIPHPRGTLAPRGPGARPVFRRAAGAGRHAAPDAE